MDPIQNPLFKEPVGAAFRAKRERMGMSIDDVAKNLRFGTQQVQAIEDENWAKLGPAIYARSYINSYIKLLGLDETIKNDIPALNGGTPTLKMITQARVEPAGIQSKTILTLVTVLGIGALLIFLNVRHNPEELSLPESSIPLAVPAIVAPASIAGHEPTAVQIAPALTTVTTTQQPATAVVSSASQQMILRSKLETWLEIRDSNNAIVTSELIPAGQERVQALEKVGKITIGNASNVVLSINGSSRDLTPFIKNEVARFSLDAQGNPTVYSPAISQ